MQYLYVNALQFHIFIVYLQKNTGDKHYDDTSSKSDL